MNYHIDGAGSVTFLQAGADPVEIEGQEAELVKAHACMVGRECGSPPAFDDGAPLPGRVEEDPAQAEALTEAYEAAFKARTEGEEEDAGEEEGGDG